MDRNRSWTRHVTPSLVISLLALFFALSGTAYAVGRGSVDTSDLARNAVTAPKLAPHAVISGKIADRSVRTRDLALGAVTSAQVANHALRLHDLGGPLEGSVLTQTELTVPAKTCRLVFLRNSEPAPGLLGAMVVGYVSDGDGGNVLDNDAVVVPTMVSGTSQGDPGEVNFNLMVCDSGGGDQVVPAGSVFHYRVIGS